MSGYYDEEGKHHCNYGHLTVYQMMSGGEEFYCAICDDQGKYPEGSGGPQARLLAEVDGHLKLRRKMYDEIAKRKGEQDVKAKEEDSPN